MLLPLAETPERPARPTSVTVAFWLQLAAVALLLLLIGLVVWYAVDFDGQIDRAARVVPDADPDEVYGERVGNVVMASVLGMLALLLAVGLAVTAPFVRQGRNAARIVVFVAAGVPLLLALGPCCAGSIFLPFAFLASPPVPDGPPPDSGADGGWGESRFIAELYNNPDPADEVFSAVGLLVAGLVFVLTVAVVLLLALPPANRYFRPRPTPDPRLHPPATPGYPAGYPMPAVPPGYMICPDPALHLGAQAAGAEPSRGQEPPPQPPTS